MNRTEKKAECARLWKEAFCDSDEFISEFISNHYCKENMLAIEDNGRILSMLHIIPFEWEGMPVAYLYGIATDKNARGKGYATELIQQAIEKVKENGFKAAFTIPAEETLSTFYSNFGFNGKYAVKFETTDNFDFGTGDRSKDLASVILFDSQIQLPTTIVLKKQQRPATTVTNL